MKSYNQIFREVSAAAEYVQAGEPVPNIISGDIDFYTSLANQPDDAIIDSDRFTHLADFGPAAVMVETIQEFRVVHDALSAVHCLPRNETVTNKDVYHEEAHLKASE